MCYLKNLGTQEHVDFDDLFGKVQDSSAECTEQEPNVLIPCAEKQIKAEWSQEQQMLVNLFDLIQKNNNMISALNKALCPDSQEPEKSSIQTEFKAEKEIEGGSYCQKDTDSIVCPLSEPTTLQEKLFGCKKYKYKIKRDSDLSSTLYKERNFNLGVQLVDPEEAPVRNYNLINLCFAVCTSNGEWIHENRVGEPFMKGKTEVELYKGEASFVKLYARDVSRNYPEGKINLVVYAKPSTLVYSNSGSYEKYVKPEEIEPLVIEDITIKAKKKE